MKHLLITLGYGNTAAIPVTDPTATGALIAALSEAVLVSREGYGADAKYIEQPGAVEVSFVPSAQVVAVDETAILRAKLEAAERDLTQTRGYWTQEQAKTKALKEQLEAKAVA